jgi:hypothetical protein
VGVLGKCGGVMGFDNSSSLTRSYSSVPYSPVSVKKNKKMVRG